MSTPALVAELADYLALLYHEARNVRHLIAKGCVSREAWGALVGLPKNKFAAWEAIRPLRSAAASAVSAGAAVSVFSDHFGVSLHQLVALYSNVAWRDAAAFGGSAWLSPAKLVAALVPAIDRAETGKCEELFATLRASRHNTDLLAAKLSLLDSKVQA
jgi:hypothetical protein